MADDPMHKVLQKEERIISPWDIVHPLVDPWKAISRCCVVHGQTSDLPRFALVVESADGLIDAGELSNPNIQAILGTGTDEEEVPKQLELGPDVLSFAFPNSKLSEDQSNDVVANILKYFAKKDEFQQLFPQAESITLQFCKLALYKEGGHFSQHKDTAHGPSHQGTLLLEVKTAHTGGKLSFQVDDEVIDWDLTEPSRNAYNLRWCAFHTDISHQMNEVISGVQAVLQFDVHVTYRDATAGKKRKRKTNKGYIFDFRSPLVDSVRFGTFSHRACQRFVAELSKYAARNFIALPLFHVYHHEYLRPELLKSMDRALFDALIVAGYRVLLTPVLMRSAGNEVYCDNTIGPCDPYDRIYSACKVKDEDGRVRIISTPAGSFRPAVMKYIFTKFVQCQRYSYFERKVDDNDDTAPYDIPPHYVSKYYSAAMVILQRPLEPGPKINPYSALLFDQASSDVTLIVQGERVPAHKEVLCACSAVFRAMFLNFMKETVSSEVMVGEEHSVETVKAMLHFIYTDAIPAPLLKAELLQLLPLAIYYQMDELKQYAEEACRAFVDVHNVQHIVQAARQHEECAALLQDILRWIADHAKLLATTNPTFVSHLDADSTELVVKAMVGLVE